MLWIYTDEIGTENRNICVGIRNINQFKIFILNWLLQRDIAKQQKQLSATLLPHSTTCLIWHRFLMLIYLLQQMCLWTHTPKWMAVSGFNWASQIFLLSKRVNRYTIGGINVTLVSDMVKNYKDVGANAIVFYITNSTSNWDGLEPWFWTDTTFDHYSQCDFWKKGSNRFLSAGHSLLEMNL